MLKRAITAKPLGRRSLLKGGIASGVALSAASAVVAQDAVTDPAAPTDPGYDRTINLEIHDVLLELVDGRLTFMWAFALKGQEPTVPGPLLRIRAGTRVRFRVENHSRVPHGFQVPGMGAGIGPLLPMDQGGERGEVVVVAADSGTYFYLDPVNAPVNRVLGLHGAIVVDAPENLTSTGRPMPYPLSQVGEGSAVDSLFSRLGYNPFPGSRWLRGEQRERVWVMNQVDPRWCARAQAGEAIDPDAFKADFKPRYFTMNGLSGYDAAHDARTVPHGHIGEPFLLRCLNAGLAWHSPHIHGNHVFEVGLNYGRLGNPSTPVANVMEIDTWAMSPGAIGDYLLPFRKPPDIPPQKWPPVQEKFPLSYPMHCHNEISQTSGGGSYPMGLVCDWVIEGV